MNAQELLTKPISAIEFDDKLRLIASLIEQTPIRQVKPTNQQCVMLFAADDVNPGSECNISARNYCTFKITTFLIVPTVREIEDAVVTEKIGPRKRSRKTAHVRRLAESPAAAWSVGQMFIGNYSAMVNSTSTSIPGAAFAVKCPIPGMIAPAGIDVALTVSHSLTTKASFRGLLFGVPAK